ncbi:hypothetical protein OIV83_006133 [Microbotryomycetes sp. JL201]|nr:hypothetical protein OIV83_006133 [Microbotryomycetes sp. JL201]
MALTVTLLLAIATALWLALRAAERWLTDVYCAVGDIQHFQDTVKHKRQGRAVIVGASISGILTGEFPGAPELHAGQRRANSHHLQPESAPNTLTPCCCSMQKSARQTRQSGATASSNITNFTVFFLGLMYPALKAMFSNFEPALYEAGGKIVPPHSVSYKGSGGGFQQLPDAQKTGWPVRQLYISREALEALLRRLLLSSCKNVDSRVGTAKGIVISQDHKRVGSVMVRSSDGQMENVECELIVDASGTTNGSIGWLKNAGFKTPEKVTYDPAIVYTCFTFHTTPATRAKYDAIKGAPRTWQQSGHIGACAAPQHYSAFLQMEDGKVRTMFQTFTGQDTDPKSVQDVETEYAVGPYEPWQQEAIKLLCRAEDDGADPAIRSKVAIGLCYRVTFDAKQMPVNLIPLGDTILRVNPIFGQGCAKSVVDALTLDRVLRQQDGRTLTQSWVNKFLDLHAKRLDPLWETTRVHDYAHPETTPCAGETREWGARRRRLLAWTASAGCKSATIGGQLCEIAAQLRPNWRIYDPRFLFQCALVHLTWR